MFPFNKPSSGSYHSCFVQVIIIDNQLKHVVMRSVRSCCCILSSPYWRVCGALCTG